jgi:hypothetical protein
VQVLVLGMRTAFSLGKWNDMADFLKARASALPNTTTLVRERGPPFVRLLASLHKLPGVRSLNP